MSCACGLEMDFEDTGPEGLARGERLLLWGVRTWAALFMQTMLLVESDLVRPLQIQCPHCAGYAMDEQRLVTACGLAAAAPGLAARLLAPLVTRPEVASTFARALNHALALDGSPLPVRMGEPVEDAQPLGMATVH